MLILVTRPLEQAKATADLLHGLGHQPIIDPLLEIAPINSTPPTTGFDGILLTSANAVPALDRFWPSGNRHTVPVLSTGKTTCNAARLAGFTRCESVQGSALDLIDRCPGWMESVDLSKKSKLLYPCAAVVATDISEQLSLQQISCLSWPVYTTTPVHSFSSSTVKGFLDHRIDFTLLYSSRTARCFADLILALETDEKVKLEELNILTLSQQIKESLPQRFQAFCRYPGQSSEQALLDLLPR